MAQEAVTIPLRQGAMAVRPCSAVQELAGSIPQPESMQVARDRVAGVLVQPTVQPTVLAVAGLAGIVNA